MEILLAVEMWIGSLKSSDEQPFAVFIRLDQCISKKLSEKYCLIRSERMTLYGIDVVPFNEIEEAEDIIESDELISFILTLLLFTKVGGLLLLFLGVPILVLLEGEFGIEIGVVGIVGFQVGKHVLFGFKILECWWDRSRISKFLVLIPICLDSILGV